MADGLPDEMMKRRIHVPAHFQNKDRHRQTGRDNDLPLQPLGLFFLFRFTIQRCIGPCNSRRIARIRRRLRQGVRRCHALQVGHLGRLGRKVHRHVDHARHGCQRLIHTTHARRTRHGFHAQLDRRFARGIAKIIQFLVDVRQARTVIQRDVQRFCGKVHRRP